jgi:hypothetical protein
MQCDPATQCNLYEAEQRREMNPDQVTGSNDSAIQTSRVIWGYFDNYALRTESWSWSQTDKELACPGHRFDRRTLEVGRTRKAATVSEVKNSGIAP